MKLALKIGSFFCKVIVGYKNENYGHNKGLKMKKKFFFLLKNASKNISRTFSGGVVGSVESVHFWIFP